MLELLDRIIAMVKAREGCRLAAYPDPGTGGAPWTIGYGETLGIQPGMMWTQQQADDRLRQRVAQFLVAVYRRCPQLYLGPDGRTAACVSLAYNIGVGAFGASSVCRCTRRTEYFAAADAFLLWIRAGGRVMRGLVLRRQAERLAYLE
jgi:lysozyme